MQSAIAFVLMEEKIASGFVPKARANTAGYNGNQL